MLKWMVSVTAVAVLALASACGDDDDDSGAAEPTAGQEEICEQAGQVTEAVVGLTDLDVLSEGTDALKTAVDDLQSELAAFKSVAGTSIQDERQALQDAVDEAQGTFADLDDEDSLNAKIDEVQTALTDVATAAQAFADAVKIECE